MFTKPTYLYKDPIVFEHSQTYFIYALEAAGPVPHLGLTLTFPPQMILLCIVLWALGDGNEQWHKNAGYAIAFGW